MKQDTEMHKGEEGIKNLMLQNSSLREHKKLNVTQHSKMQKSDLYALSLDKIHIVIK